MDRKNPVDADCHEAALLQDGMSLADIDTLDTGI